MSSEIHILFVILFILIIAVVLCGLMVVNIIEGLINEVAKLKEVATYLDERINNLEEREDYR